LIDLSDVNVSFVPETIKSGDIDQDYNCIICHRLSLIGSYSFGENISMVQWGRSWVIPYGRGGQTKDHKMFIGVSSLSTYHGTNYDIIIYYDNM